MPRSLRTLMTKLLLWASLAMASLAPACAQMPVFISTEWLAQHLDDEKTYLIDLSDDMQYARFHIPGAVHVRYGWLFPPGQKLALSGGARYMQQVLSQLGVRADDTVVIYDDTAGLNGARLFWELKKLGHENAALLDGGTVAWVLERRRMTQTPAKFRPKSQYPLPENDRADALTATTQAVLAAVKDDDTLLVDVRSEEEYVGSPQDPRSGHIPGAIHFEWIEAVALDRQFKEKDRDTLLKLLAMKGIRDKTQPIILYCRTGHRAARMFASLKNLGFQRVSVYDGSMQAWMRDPRLPLKQGKTP